MSPSEIEKIAAFKDICPYIDSARQEELARDLGICSPNLDRRLEGLRNEDELILVLHFLRCCRHILRFEEGAARLTGTAAPDLLVQLRSGESLLIEAKSSQNDLLELGTGRVSKCMGVAQDLGLPLYFALKQRGVWGLFSAEHVLAQTGRLRLVNDFTRSEFGTKFGSQWYVLSRGLEFRHLYDRDGHGLVQSNHGPLVRCDVRLGGRRILRATRNEANMFAVHLLRGAVIQGETIGPESGRRRGSLTRVVHQLVFPLMMADYQFYLHLIHSTGREGGVKYDKTAYLKALQSRDEPVTADLVRRVFGLLESGGLMVPRLATYSPLPDGEGAS